MSSSKPPLIAKAVKPDNDDKSDSPVDDTSTKNINGVVASKVWILPPRPKPGRKPSADSNTANSKRKAQNRTAQRAFRERKAQRVYELQEKMQKLEQERDSREAKLLKALQNITKDNEKLHETLKDLQTNQLELATRNSINNSHDSSLIATPAASPAGTGNSDDSCNVCVEDDCICEAVGLKKVSTKTSKTNNGEPMEIDFTARYGRHANNQSTTTEQPTHDQSTHNQSTHNPNHSRRNNHDGHHVSSADRCGFCSDGTPCVCEEMQDNTLPPLSFPSPSPNDLKISTLQPDITDINTPLLASNSSCSGNPGNCRRCQTDPMNTLFCTTLASSQNTGNTASDNGGMYIPCSAAYQTLSRHKDFSRADLGKLVGKLHTKGMQVEVSSVANVLRELDRRLYD